MFKKIYQFFFGRKNYQGKVPAIGVGKTVYNNELVPEGYWFHETKASSKYFSGMTQEEESLEIKKMKIKQAHQLHNIKKQLS